MADRKISDLTALTTPATGDLLPIVDISEAAAADKNKSITVGELLRGAPDGTAAAPGIAFESDPNSGIYSPGADQVAISTGGTGRLFVDANGNVGAGTASPRARVDFGSGSGNGVLNQTVSNYQAVFESPQGTGNIARNIAFAVGTNGIGAAINAVDTGGSDATGLIVATGTAGSITERLRIDSNGNVGVGTSSPQLQLSLNHVTQPKFGLFVNNTEQYRFQAVSGGNYIDLLNANLIIRGGASGTTNIAAITNAGNVGIGTTSPTRLLTVQSTGNANFCIKSSNTGVSQCMFGDTDSDVAGTIAYRHSDNAMTFEVNSAERARIDSSGRLLVGTPIARSVAGVTGGFHLTGTGADSCLNVSRYSANTGPAILQFGKSRGTSDGSYTIVSNGDQLGSISFAGADGTDLNSIAASIAANVDGTPGANDMPGRLVFSTTADGASSPTERMRIDSTGAITQATQPILKTNGSSTFGSAGSLTSSPASAIVQATAQFERGDNGWTTSGSNAYTFVCPVDGIYAVFANVSYGNIAQGNRVIWVLGYTLGGGNLPLSNYVEVLDHTIADYMNESYYELWSFTAGTRVGMGMNGVSGSQPGYDIGWGIHLVA